MAPSPAWTAGVSRVLRVFATLPAVALASLLQAAGPGQTPPATSQAPQKPVFRSGVNLIAVDVVALDRANQPVSDLTMEEFQVFENGSRQEVVSFTQVELPIPPPHQPPQSDIASNAGAGEGRLIFLVLDDVNSMRTRTDAVRQAARRLVERLSPQDQVALLWVSLQRLGAREFTTDHAAILRAIDQFEAEQSRIERRVGPNVQTDLPTDPESGMSMGSVALANLNLKALFGADRPFRIVQDVSKYLAGIERRRKAIVYIGQGANRLTGPEMGQGEEQRKLAALPVDRAVNEAVEGNVTFYAIDPSGPSVPGREELDRPEGPQAVGDFARLGAETGGFASFRPDLPEAVDRVLSATSIYYLLGYYAGPTVRKEDRRRIEVRTTRPGVRILARKGYRPADAASPADAREEAFRTVRDLVPISDLSLKAFAAPFRGAKREEQPIAITIEVGAPEFATSDQGAGFRDDVELVVLAIEPGEQVRVSQRVTAHVALDPEKAAALSGGRYVLCARVNVPPGQYQLRIGARSAVAGRSGSVYYDVTVPDFRERPMSLSGLVIGQATSDAPMPVARASTIASLVPFVPVLAREFAPAGEAWAYVRVYRGKGAGDQPSLVTTTISRVETGAVVWTTSEQRPAAAFAPAGEAEYRVTLPLEALPTGAYRLRIEAAASSGQAAVSRELDFRVREESTVRVPQASPTLAPRPPAPPVAIPRQEDPELQALLERACEYLTKYLEDFSAVVAEETYEQTVGGPAGRRAAPFRGARRLRSDLLLVRLSGEPGWTPFRDVFEVDGRPVRDRDDRLRTLFVEMPEGALDAARRILDEGARYNIGSVYRNINQPVLALVFLLPENLPRIQFTRKGEDRVEGVRARRVDYKETGRPTVIRQAASDRDLPSSGSFWIEPATGRIVKTVHQTSDGLFRVETSVVYRPSDTLGLWAPAEMRELYTSPGERIYGKAVYQNFRRFHVKTETVIKVPKGR